MFKLPDVDCEIHGKSHGKESCVKVLFQFLTLRQLQELAQQYMSMLCAKEHVAISWYSQNVLMSAFFFFLREICIIFVDCLNPGIS